MFVVFVDTWIVFVDTWIGHLWMFVVFVDTWIGYRAPLDELSSLGTSNCQMALYKVKHW